MYDSFFEGDIPKALSVVDPEVVWIELFPFAGTYIGPQAIKEVFERVLDEFESYEMTFDCFIEDNDLVVVLGNYKVKRKNVDDIFEAHFVHAFWVSDDKVVKYEQFTDTAKAIRTLKLT